MIQITDTKINGFIRIPNYFMFPIPKIIGPTIKIADKNSNDHSNMGHSWLVIQIMAAMYVAIS